jgi:hypothetical protein
VTVPVPLKPQCFILPPDSQRTVVSIAKAGAASARTTIARQNFFMTGSSTVMLARNLPNNGVPMFAAVLFLVAALAGAFGGLVGNQGGIRSAALLGFDLSRDAFVATATAIGLFVDCARMPVYLATQHAQLRSLALQIAIAIAGVVIGFHC